MKWRVLAPIVFLCMVAAVATLPPSAQLGVGDTVQNVFDTISVVVRRIADRVDEQVGDVRREPRSPRTRAPDADLSGRARVIDGDTIEIGTVGVRLYGVDAPESAQSCLAEGQRWPCGQRATQALDRQIGGRTVACSERDRDRYGRIVAVCRHGGRDINAWLVRQGWALAYRQYSRAYVNEEASAKAERRGIWRGEFVPPWDWRRGKRLRSSRQSTGRDTRLDTGHGTGRCRIKGNIGRDGARIYHVPGGRYYERTRISPSKGERWFCSEAEARAAGWRRSRR